MSEAPNFKVGDIVQLKSGGPDMVIDQINKKTSNGPLHAWCSFYDGKKLQKGVHPLTSIKMK